MWLVMNLSSSSIVLFSTILSKLLYINYGFFHYSYYTIYFDRVTAEIFIFHIIDLNSKVLVLYVCIMYNQHKKIPTIDSASWFLYIEQWWNLVFNFEIILVVKSGLLYYIL
jgi:hypothetical protein